MKCLFSLSVSPQVTDGFNPLHRAFSISILPVNNQLPTLMIQPIRLREKGFTYISPSQLTAQDQDTPSEQIVFTITQSPFFGSIQRSGTTVTSFTQNDLENGRITYVHTGPEATDGQSVQDSFKVKISDGDHRKFYVFPDMDTPTSRSQRVSACSNPPLAL